MKVVKPEVSAWRRVTRIPWRPLSALTTRPLPIQIPTCDPRPYTTTSPIRGLCRLARWWRRAHAYIARAEWLPPRRELTPARRYAKRTRPEQSNAPGPVAPWRYGSPRWARATRTIRRRGLVTRLVATRTAAMSVVAGAGSTTMAGGAVGSGSGSGAGTGSGDGTGVGVGSGAGSTGSVMTTGSVGGTGSVAVAVAGTRVMPPMATSVARPKARRPALNRKVLLSASARRSGARRGDGTVPPGQEGEG